VHAHAPITHSTEIVQLPAPTTLFPTETPAGAPLQLAFDVLGSLPTTAQSEPTVPSEAEGSVARELASENPTATDTAQPSPTPPPTSTITPTIAQSEPTVPSDAEHNPASELASPEPAATDTTQPSPTATFTPTPEPSVTLTPSQTASASAPTIDTLVATVVPEQPLISDLGIIATNTLPPSLVPPPSLTPLPIARVLTTRIALQVTRPPPQPTYTSGGEGCAPQGFPVHGILTRGFSSWHPGIDLAVDLGTPVLATHSGMVVFAGWRWDGYGNLVIIQNGRFITYYAHNHTLLVSAGQVVHAGATIALSGSTGWSTGPHVHYEIHVDDVPVNPETFDSRGFRSC